MSRRMRRSLPGPACIPPVSAASSRFRLTFAPGSISIFDMRCAPTRELYRLSRVVSSAAMKTGFSSIPGLAGLAFLGAGSALAAPASPPPVPPAAAVRTINLAEGTCNTIPKVAAVTFAIPADYVTRAPASRKPGVGCFWGTAPDLDRAMRDPKGVDFSAIRHGVFWARPAGNVGFNAAKNQFFDGRGSDEAAMKRAFERAGAKNT